LFLSQTLDFVVTNPNPISFHSSFSINKSTSIYRKIYAYIILKQICFKIKPNPSQISIKTNFPKKSVRTKSVQLPRSPHALFHVPHAQQAASWPKFGISCASCANGIINGPSDHCVSVL
jgi:hypothetical protein